MKKECAMYQSMVEPFLEGKLSGSNRSDFIEHVKSCKVCHEELEIYHVIYSVLDELDTDSGKETSNYMASLEKKLGSGSGSDSMLFGMNAAYGFAIAGLASILAGVLLLLI
ncbi:MAG: hypothetical protein K6G24_00460 [Lachnospiraceae bacterium]|nr:hypothetical protein [Lachnospiraceae bacterium]